MFICLIIGAVSLHQLIIFVTITTHALFAVTQSSLCCKTQVESVQSDKAHNLKISAVFSSNSVCLALGHFTFEHCHCRARFEETPSK